MALDSIGIQSTAYLGIFIVECAHSDGARVWFIQDNNGYDRTFDHRPTAADVDRYRNDYYPHLPISNLKEVSL